MSPRSEAKKQGLKTYLSGKDCVKGHTNPERRTDSGSCVECSKASKESLRIRQERFKEKNHERLKEIKRESMRRSRKENRDRHLAYERERMRKVNATDKGKLRQFIKGSLRRCLQHKNGKRSYSLVGYGFTELRERIDSMLTGGMTWDNYGEWHIDHIKPIKAFLDEGVTDPKIINALSNLQPLWAHENIKKGDKFNVQSK
jgi:hypothetical protein